MQVRDMSGLAQFAQRFYEFLPTLAAGLFLTAIGLVAGWLLKRAIVRVLIWLRLDRLASRVGWRAALGKGDIRSALYNVLGSIGMVVVVLIFLDNALQIWGLTVLVRMVDAILLYLPNLVVAGIIVGVGTALSSIVARRVEDGLEEEEFTHPRLVARTVKSVLLAIVTALALWQLEFARQIILAAFLIGFGAIGVGFAVAVGLGSAKAIQQGWDALFSKRKQ